MKTKLLLTFIFLLTLAITNAQSVSIKGKITDTSSGEKIKNAAICLLEAKDSMLQNFTRSDAEGNFELKNTDTGKYIVLISYPSYADYVQEINIAHKDTAIQLGTINVIQTAHLLKDVIVKQQLSAIRIKGDTTEFAADSFKVQPNATVEDLLKELPGVQVDKDGKITAQGQTVQKVLVDGEEFFGDDPTLVTKNLRADMVDKVQLFDKSSDQAAFTGIDDGNKQKTINLKLKENKKNGYFGKLSGGVGTDNYKETQDMFNYFKGKQKIAGYLTLSNTGKSGLGYQDEDKYGTSSGIMEATDNGGFSYFGSSASDPLQSLQSWNGNYDGNGIPNAKTGGVHYDNKWDNDNQYINLNYKIGSIGEKGNSQVLTQNNLPTGILLSKNNNKFYKDVYRQKADGIYTVQLDSSSTLKLALGGSISHSTSDNFGADSTLRNGDSLVNRAFDSSRFKGTTKAFNVNALWQKKFKKKGRTISLNVNEYIKNTDDNGFINNHNEFYNNNGISDSIYSVDQRKINNTKTNSLDASLAYTEPLSKYLSLVANYGLDIENATSDILSYNRNADGDYTVIDSAYSNHYIYNQSTNNGGISFVYNKNKINFNFGTKVGATQYHQKNTFSPTEQSLDRSFVNWAPNANFTYKFSQETNLRFYYNGRTQQPTIDQIQPVANNTDNLNIFVGNPLLKPSFSNSFRINYFNYKVLSQRGFGIFGYYNVTTNPIVTDITTNDSTGASIYRYANIGTATSNYDLTINASKKLKKLDLYTGVYLELGGNKYATYTNDVLNVTNTRNYNLNWYLSKSKDKKYYLELNASAGYNTTHYTLQNQIDNNYWSLNIRPNFDVYLPAKFQIHTDGNYQWNEKTQVAPTYHQFIWNAWLGKKFFKKENLLLKFSCNDILNQNNGFNRTPNNTGGFQQNITSTIRRYYMFSIVWDFSKMGGAASAGK